MLTPTPKEYEAARRRIRARNWISRARMLTYTGMLCTDELKLLEGDTPEKANRDRDVCQVWQERIGYDPYV